MVSGVGKSLSLTVDILEYRDFCLTFPAAEECMPFGDNVLVFKVMSKMFTYAEIDGFCRFCVKCNPALAIELREQHPEITRGIHSNSAHWNTVRADGKLSGEFVKQQIRNSYDLVVAGLTRAAKAELLSLTTNS